MDCAVMLFLFSLVILLISVFASEISSRPPETLLWNAYVRYDEESYCPIETDLAHKCNLATSECSDAVKVFFEGCSFTDYVKTSNFLRYDGGVCDTPCEYDFQLELFTCSGIMCLPPQDYVKTLKRINAKWRNNSEVLLYLYKKNFPVSYGIAESHLKPAVEYVMYPYLDSDEMSIKFLPLSITANITHVAVWANDLDEDAELTHFGLKQLIPISLYGHRREENVYNMIRPLSGDHECDWLLRLAKKYVATGRERRRHVVLTATLLYNFLEPSPVTRPDMVLFTVHFYGRGIESRESIKCVIK
ncbi:hypothetical protein F8203_gp035 [Heliothis virescens ascovirus 3f]|uniref:Uncharacterized protein n=1 Tax=Heliothis virescens ascovirus 3f TaxID=328614 RepID=A0A171PVC9_9VIRU|nr:hypothetical protein F8203_gp035 [Heliothis virescens ascovirus 3f]AJP09001.1 hypothetical protein [Heliothis virescens ascovirus 3f]